MDEKDLKDRLEKLGLPEPGLPRHKDRLKTVLLQKALRAGDKHTDKGVITVMKNILTSRQPVWRIALPALLILALLAGSFAFLPGGSEPAKAELTDVALALSITQNRHDIIVEAAGSEEEAKDYNVHVGYVYDDDRILIEIKDTKASYLFPDTMAVWELRVWVDMVEEKVSDYIYRRDYISEVEKEAAREVLTADPRTKELLDAGAELVFETTPNFGVDAGYSYDTEWDEETGQEIPINDYIKFYVELVLSEETYGARIDLGRGGSVLSSATRIYSLPLRMIQPELWKS